MKTLYTATKMGNENQIKLSSETLPKTNIIPIMVAKYVRDSFKRTTFVKELPNRERKGICL